MKRLIVIGLALLLALSAEAGPRRVPHVAFARFERNALSFPGGNSPDFNLFLRKLDTLRTTGRGDVRILHVGGSHVQGGTWTDQLRQDFLALGYGLDGGRGLVFPFSAAGTNTPVSYSSSYTGAWTSARCLHPDGALGVTGMSVTAQDTSARFIIDLQPRENKQWIPRYMVRSVDVLGYGEMEPVLLLWGRDTLRGVPGRGLWHFDLPVFTDRVELAFLRPGGQYTVKGLYLDRPGYGLTLSEAGVNGASTSSWLKCDDWEKDLRRLRPDLVIFSIGINDIQGRDFDAAAFRRNYGKLIRMVHKVNPRCAILFTSNNDSWKKGAPNPFTEEAEKAFEALARQYKAAFWDLYDIMGGYGSMEKWQEAGLAQPDKVHFTPEGYRLLGDLLFNAIMDCYGR